MQVQWMWHDVAPSGVIVLLLHLVEMIVYVILSPQLDRGIGTVVSSVVRGIKAEEGTGETTGTTITVAVVATPAAEGGEAVGVGRVELEETVPGETETETVEGTVKT